MVLEIEATGGKKMKTKAMVVGSMAAFVLLVGVSIFAAGSGLSDDAVPAGDLIGDILREGQDNGQGDMERVMNEDCVLDEPEQAREQTKDGSCDEDDVVEEEEEADVLAAPIHDRDRDQVNGGTGPQYRNGEE